MTKQVKDSVGLRYYTLLLYVRTKEEIHRYFDQCPPMYLEHRNVLLPVPGVKNIYELPPDHYCLNPSSFCLWSEDMVV